MDWGYPLTQPGASYGAPGAPAPAAPTSPFGGGGFTDMLNTLSGSLPDINNGLQTLAYGIGSFAKDPRKRAMYIQAALEHQKAMSSDKAAHLKALDDHSNELLDFVVKSNGNPQVLNILKPVVDHQYAAIKTLAGSDAADAFKAKFDAAAAMPPAKQELGKVWDAATNQYVYGVPKPGDVAEPGKGPDLPAAVQEYQFAQKQGFKGTFQDWELQQKIAGRTPAAGPAPDRTMVEIYDPSPDNPTHRRMIPRSEYAGQPTGVPQTPSSQEVIAPILKIVAEKGRGALTPAQQDALDVYAQTNPLAIMQRNIMQGGSAPSAPAPQQQSAAPAAPPVAAAPVPAAATVPTGQSKDAPIPITPDNSVAIVKGIVATGQPMWLQGPDGKVEQVTPENAKAWLQLHKVQ